MGAAALGLTVSLALIVVLLSFGVPTGDGTLAAGYWILLAFAAWLCGLSATTLWQHGRSELQPAHVRRRQRRVLRSQARQQNRALRERENRICALETDFRSYEEHIPAFRESIDRRDRSALPRWAQREYDDGAHTIHKAFDLILQRIAEERSRWKEGTVTPGVAEEIATIFSSARATHTSICSLDGKVRDLRDQATLELERATRAVMAARDRGRQLRGAEDESATLADRLTALTRQIERNPEGPDDASRYLITLAQNLLEDAQRLMRELSER